MKKVFSIFLALIMVFAIFSISVSAEDKKVVSISIKTMPNKTEYLFKEEFDPEGLTVLVRYDDGSTEVIEDGFELSNTELNQKGQRYVTVSYEGHSAAFTIQVNYRRWQSIAFVFNFVVKLVVTMIKNMASYI